MPDETLKRILAMILEIGKRSPRRALVVCAFLRDYLQTMNELGILFDTSKQAVHEHLTEAGKDHPEITALLKSKYRADVVRQRANRRRKK